MTTSLEGSPPVTRRVRAYFAPVDRATGVPTIFDAAQAGRFDLEAPPAPWRDLGWCERLTRNGAKGEGMAALRSGAQAMVASQVRTAADATVALEFATWGKLQLAVSSGSQQMNLLATAGSSVAAVGSGGAAVAAQALDGASTASVLVVGVAAAAQFSAGDYVVVDADYTGQTGFVGSGVSGAYVRPDATLGLDATLSVDAIRRISLNVGRVASISEGSLTLEQPLPAGAPAAGMKAARVVGFVDREGSSFFQQWSALFVLDGEQGDRVLLHYPRLEAMHGAAESVEPLQPSGTLQQIRLAAAFRALPVTDPNDGETVLCFRSYLPTRIEST